MAKKATTQNVEETQAIHVTENIQRDVDIAVEKRLVALYTLQRVDSEIDKIKIIRGELPQAVQDLEDEIAGLETRIENQTRALNEAIEAVGQYDREIAEHQEQIAKYQKQQDNVRNNREYEAINKEIEYKELEIQLCERKKREAKDTQSETQRHIEAAQALKEKNTNELQVKKDELDDIISETEKDEARLLSKSKEQEQFIEERYLTAYKRIRTAARNGLAVVQIDRNACAGCFAKIPPQRQMEIRMHKKVIVCEHCGRILVDGDIAEKSEELLNR